jgi:hypothetical protein
MRAPSVLALQVRVSEQLSFKLESNSPKLPFLTLNQKRGCPIWLNSRRCASSFEQSLINLTATAPAGGKPGQVVHCPEPELHLTFMITGTAAGRTAQVYRKTLNLSKQGRCHRYPHSTTSVRPSVSVITPTPPAVTPGSRAAGASGGCRLRHRDRRA